MSIIFSFDFKYFMSLFCFLSFVDQVINRGLEITFLSNIYMYYSIYIYIQWFQSNFLSLTYPTSHPDLMSWASFSMHWPLRCWSKQGRGVRQEMGSWGEVYLRRSWTEWVSIKVVVNAVLRTEILCAPQQTWTRWFDWLIFRIGFGWQHR